MLKNTTFWVMLAQVPLAWDWFKAGWDKLTEGGLGAKFAEELPATLERFAQQKTPTGEIIRNPHTWYVDTFLNSAKDSANLFGYLVVYGELAVGAILFIAIGYYLVTRKQLPKLLIWLVSLGLIGGILMNINYYFAAGWPVSAVSTRSLNVMMTLSELIFLGYYVFGSKKKKVVNQSQ